LALKIEENAEKLFQNYFSGAIDCKSISNKSG
jgi:hypothetical protein